MRYFWSPFTSASFVAVGLVIGVIGDLKEVVQVEKDSEDNHQEYITPAPPHVGVGDKSFVSIAINFR